METLSYLVAALLIWMALIIIGIVCIYYLSIKVSKKFDERMGKIWRDKNER